MVSGNIQGMVVGVAALVIGVIIAFILVTNVATIDDTISVTKSSSKTDETVTQVELIANSPLDAVGQHSSTSGFAISSVLNGTGGIAISSGNYTLSTSAGTLTNTTSEFNTEDWIVDYTYNYEITQDAADNLIGNFTVGVDNVSSKIPTILLILAVVLVLGILVLLWVQYKRMGIGGGSSL